MKHESAAAKLLAVALFPLVCLTGLIAFSAERRDAAPVTFTKDVAPILYKHCATCHHAGSIAPMSLLTYGEVKPWAEEIRGKVVAREMPPWHADAHFGEFFNDRRLSEQEIKTLSDWVAQGALEGNKNELPPAPDFSEQWSIGQPDVVLSMLGEYAFGAESDDQYVYFRIPTNFKEDRWIQAVEFRPGNRKIVHHAVAFIETPENFAEQQRLNPSPKSRAAVWTLLDTEAAPIELMSGTTRRVRADVPVVNDGCSAPDRDAVGVNTNPEVLSVYAPGREAEVWPIGTAKRIPAGSNIVFQMHYSKRPGKVEKDRTSIALIFAKTPVEKMVGTRSVSNDLFLIPAGAQDHIVTACWTFQRDAELISFMPHMHMRGKSMKYEALYADGRRETLLSVPQYDFHWQTLYVLKRPLTIPSGTKLIVTAHYDNSAKNMHNPDPSKAVRHGTATFDEMMIGFVNYIIPRPKDRVIVKVDPKVYDAYVGEYELAPNASLKIVRDGESLFAVADGQRIELFPLSETTFFSKATESELTFVRNERGEVTGFVVTLNDKLVRVKKLK